MSESNQGYNCAACQHGECNNCIGDGAYCACDHNRMSEEPYTHTLRAGDQLTAVDMLMLEKLSDGINRMRAEIAQLKEQLATAEKRGMERAMSIACTMAPDQRTRIHEAICAAVARMEAKP